MKENLRLLSIFHYVVGGLHALLSCIWLIYVVLGIMFMVAPEGFHGAGNDQPPAFLGVLFTVIGGVLVLLGWTFAGLTILSGKYIARRKKRIFSIVIAAINCLFFPFGMALGVFTLIMLTKDEARAMYETQQ